MKILLIEDEEAQRGLLIGFLTKQGYEIVDAESAEKGIDIFETEMIDLVLVDNKLPGMSGVEALSKMKSIKPTVKAIMITAYGDVDTAVSVMKIGANDFLTKPIDLTKLLCKIQELDQEVTVMEDIAQIKDKVEEGNLPILMVAESQAMKEVLSFAKRVASSPLTVLIKGETGTGKELVARLLHVLSDRKDHPFIDVNCAAIPENLFESELFGHEEGSFTSAVNLRKGRFELANKGSLFLDEVGELPMTLQAKLLRAIQERKITRIGGEVDIPVDVRLIAATNRDLPQLVNEGQFREDLYFRLKVLDIEIPPLRERKQDIAALIDYFLNKYSTTSKKISSEAMDRLLKYPFPGNVRELENAIQRLLTLSRGSVINLVDLPTEIRHYSFESKGKLPERMAAVEKEMIIAALEKSSWVQTKAADLLEISERVLRYKMSKFGIRRNKNSTL
ncbi:MAG: sigma-54-dependent transcriptional regulator [bacterium]